MFISWTPNVRTYERTHAFHVFEAVVVQLWRGHFSAPALEYRGQGGAGEDVGALGLSVCVSKEIG